MAIRATVFDCVSITRNANAAMLLYRLVYWQPRSRVTRGGFSWVIKTQEEWAHECHLSVRQVQRAFHTLRRLGLIACERHFWRTILPQWTRLTTEAIHVISTRALATPDTPDGVSGSPKTATPSSLREDIRKKSIQEPNEVDTRANLESNLGKKPQERVVPKEQGRATSRRRFRQSESDVGFGFDEGVIGQPPPVVGEEEETPQGKEESTLPSRGVASTLRDLLQVSRVSDEVMVQMVATAKDAGDYERIWRKGVHKYWGGRGYFGYLAPRERKMLRDFVAVCPLGTAAYVLHEVVKGWDSFGGFVKEELQWVKVPKRPDLGWLLFNRNMAVEWVARQQQEPTVGGTARRRFFVYRKGHWVECSETMALASKERGMHVREEQV